MKCGTTTSCSRHNIWERVYIQSWVRIIIPLVKDAAECNRVEILRGVNVESMTRGDPQITRPRERHMGPCVCVSVLSCSKNCVRTKRSYSSQQNATDGIALSVRFIRVNNYIMHILFNDYLSTEFLYNAD